MFEILNRWVNRPKISQAAAAAAFESEMIALKQRASFVFGYLKGMGAAASANVRGRLEYIAFLEAEVQMLRAEKQDALRKVLWQPCFPSQR